MSYETTVKTIRPVLFTIALFTFVVFVTITGCGQDNGIVGKWGLDKQKALVSQIKMNEEAIGRKLRKNEVARLNHLIDQSWCNYEFYKDGSVSIDFAMTARSKAKETGQWKKEGTTIIVHSTNLVTRKTGTRLWKIEGEQLVWQQPNGSVYYLERKAK
jgi:hypothetical protein